MTPWMVPSVKRLTSPSWVLISFVARHLMPFWLRLIIANASFESTLRRHVLPVFDWRSSMPDDLFVRDKLSTIFIHLDDGITPAQLRFNVSQLAGNFRLDWITPYKRLI